MWPEPEAVDASEEPIPCNRDTGVDLVLWTASVRTVDALGFVAAAKAGGFTSIAIPPEAYTIARATGVAARDLIHAARDAGAPLRYLDSCTGWAPVRVPRGAHPLVQARYDLDLDASFRICEELELTSILAMAGYMPGDCTRTQIVDGFGDLCERARRAGIHVDLEFMPFFGMPNLADAWDVVRAVGAANSGILVDTWHFMNGDADFDLLDRIPGQYLTGLQVADGALDHRGRTLFDECIDYRAFPGEGELPVADIVRRVAAKGHLRHVGPEVFSAAADALPMEEAARRSGDSTRGVLAEAGVIAVSEVRTR